MWVCACSVPSDSATPWTVAHQAPLSMEFSRQEYWNGLPFLTSKGMSTFHMLESHTFALCFQGARDSFHLRKKCMLFAAHFLLRRKHAFLFCKVACRSRCFSVLELFCSYINILLQYFLTVFPLLPKCSFPVS